MITKLCQICDAAFSVKPYRANTARFCSGSCRAKWVCSLPHNRKPRPRMLGNQLRAGLRPTNAFQPGETVGAKNAKWTPGIKLRCEHCGSTFERKPNEVRMRHRIRFCNRACFLASGCFKGDGSPLYCGGPTTVRGDNWRQLRLTVIEEQGGDCAECGKHIGRQLHVHHKRPFREFADAEDANARANLIGLCNSCHAKADRNFERFNTAAHAAARLRRMALRSPQESPFGP